jgi:hypothetical protein
MTDSLANLRRGPLGGIKDWTLSLPRHKDLRNVARFLSFYLDANGNAFPSMELIADECVMSWRTVRKLLAWLIDLGFLADTGRRVGPAQVRVLHVVGYVPAEWQMRNAMRLTVDKLSPVPAPERAAPAASEQANRGTSFNTGEVPEPKQPTAEQPPAKTPALSRVREFIARKKMEMAAMALQGARQASVCAMDALSGLLPGHAVPS